MMATAPRDPGLDHSLALLREGYRFIGNRCRRLDSDVFETRLLGRWTTCLAGADAARVFYDPAHMQRQGAMPGFVKYPLLGQGGVQGLDGEAHRHRKALFMHLMDSSRLARLNALADEELEHAGADWQQRGRVVLLDELLRVFCRTVCAWTGVPLATEAVTPLTRDLDAMVAGSARPGWDHWRARRARKRCDAWAAKLVIQVRDGELAVASDMPLARVALYRGPNDRLLPPAVAGVELLNILRPTVAVAYYVTFTAHALHAYPRAREAVVAGGNGEQERFIQEVRRLYPFFPFAAARVAEPFDWRGYRFPAGRRVLLDLYGTNRHPGTWSDPDEFRPARFAPEPPGPFDLVPQGGGDHDLHHRCAGEWMTLGLMKTALDFMALRLDYQVPEQDLTIPLNRFPTWPNDRLVIEPAPRRG